MSPCQAAGFADQSSSSALGVHEQQKINGDSRGEQLPCAWFLSSSTGVVGCGPCSGVVCVVGTCWCDAGLRRQQTLSPRTGPSPAPLGVGRDKHGIPVSRRRAEVMARRGDAAAEGRWTIGGSPPAQPSCAPALAPRPCSRPRALAPGRAGAGRCREDAVPAPSPAVPGDVCWWVRLRFVSVRLRVFCHGVGRVVFFFLLFHLMVPLHLLLL